jgi:tetratricopeptide (TPR) repeat protein
MIQKLGKYSIVEKLGEGAMGSVYKGYDEVLDRHVAIKTMAEDIRWNAELKLRFYREARSAASLHHPNIVVIHDLGEEGKITYIVMELLDGKDLKDLIKNRDPLALEEKISICAQVCEGLNHAHRAGIVHRDIKPGNIHFSVGGTVKIVDFGIAHIPSSDLTQSGVRLGTPIYMSPEQIRGETPDAQSDMFSAGIVFYELLTYVHPFRDKNMTKTLDNILFQNHFAFAEQLPDAPAGLWPILRTMLEKERGKRYLTMADAARAFRSLLADLEAASIKSAASLSQAKEDERRLEEQRQAQENERKLEEQRQAQMEAERQLAEQRQARHAALLEEARRALASRQYTPAIEALNEILQADAGHAAAAELRRQALVEAEAERTLLARRAAEIADLLGQGRASLRQEDFHAADARARKILELDPENADAGSLLKSISQARETKRRQEQIDALLASAKEALSRQDFAAAAASCSDALAIDPGHDGAKNLLLSIRQADEKKRREERIGQLLTLGHEAFQREDLAEAEKLARQALEEDPQHVRAKEFLAHIDETRQRRRKAEIAALVAHGRQALGRGAFPEAIDFGRQALAMDPEGIDAKNLLAAVEQAKENLRQAEIATALEAGRRALAGGDFEEAARKAEWVLNAEAKNKEAGILLKNIKQERKSRAKAEAKEKQRLEKENRRLEKEKRDAAAAASMDATVVLEHPEAAGKTARHGYGKIIAWAGVTVVVIAAAAFLAYRFYGPVRVPDISAQLAAAQANLERGLYDEAIAAAQSALDAVPGNAQASSLIESARTQKNAKEVSTLLLEAQSLRSQGKFQESLDTLAQLLARDPANESALSVKSQTESEIAATKSSEEQDAAAKTWLANAGALLATGKLAEAGAELDKVARLRPDMPELKVLRRQLLSRNEEVARLNRQKQDFDQKRKLTEDLGIQAEAQFGQGKYLEATKTIEQWLAAASQNSRAQMLQRQTQQALQYLKSYETYMAEKAYDQALTALGQLEKINPGDPQGGELRRRVEERRAAAKAFLFVYRLGLPGKLILDGAPVGTDGELENKSIAIGRHKLAIENSAGKQAGITLDYADGQTGAYVYEVGTLELRAMVDSDRVLLDRRRALEHTDSYEVEHRHLLGKCTGMLIVNGIRVAYRASDKSHSFEMPFSSLRLLYHPGEDKIEIQVIESKRSSSSGSSWTFKLQNAAQAAGIKELWDRLRKLIQ